MIDGCGRTIDHLRLSLTDHCNLACRYCVSEDAPPPSQMIDTEFAFQVVRWLSRDHGIRNLRLTGGEPLLFPGLAPLIERFGTLESLHEMSLTTNAQALAQHALALRSAGLSRVNVSLDTLDPERFAYITRGGRLDRTLAGIEAAVDSGLTPVKINVVAQRGLNHDELPEIAHWGLSRGCVVRVLEVMPIGPLAHVVDQHVVPAAEILERLSRHFELCPIATRPGQPATDYAAASAGFRGVIGIIAPTTKPFCDRCRRLRVTSRGELVPCVHDRSSTSLARAWDGHQLNVALADRFLADAIAAKPEIGPRNQLITMTALGG